MRRQQTKGKRQKELRWNEVAAGAMNGGKPRKARAPCDNKDCLLRAHKSSSSEPLITLATLPRTRAKWRAVVAADDVLEGERHYYSLQFTGMAATAWWWPWCPADVTPTLPISHWADVHRSIQGSASTESHQIMPIRRDSTKGSGHLEKASCSVGRFQKGNGQLDTSANKTIVAHLLAITAQRN